MGSIDEAEVSEPISRMDEAADASISGDLPRYHALLDRTAGSTLMPPYGGELERQHGLVFRRVDDQWPLLHRHADPLVHPIPWKHLGELARGLDL